MLSILLVGCSNEVEEESLSKNGDLAESCNCLAKKYNLDMDLDLHAEWQTSLCKVTHKTERSWEAELSLQQLEGLRQQYVLDKFALAPAFEACLKKELPGYPNKKQDIGNLDDAQHKCSLKVFKTKSMFNTGKCWGLE